MSAAMRKKQELALHGGRRSWLAYSPLGPRSRMRGFRVRRLLVLLSVVCALGFTMRFLLSRTPDHDAARPGTKARHALHHTSSWRNLPTTDSSDVRRNMTIAVTGASGKIGSQLVPYLLRHGYKVVAIDKALTEDAPMNDGYRFEQLDTTDYGAVLHGLRASRVHGLIHLAGIGHPGDYVYKTHNLNVVSSWNTLRAAAEVGIERVAIASSVNVIGMVWGDVVEIDYVPIDEYHPVRPRDPYSLSKQIVEFQADALSRQFPRMRIASIRLPGVYESSSLALERQADRARKDLWGWIGMDDAIRALIAGVTANGAWTTGHERIFATSQTVGDAANSQELLARYWPDVQQKRKFVGQETLFDNYKAKLLLGWTPVL